MPTRNVRKRKQPSSDNNTSIAPSQRSPPSTRRRYDLRPRTPPDIPYSPAYQAAMLDAQFRGCSIRACPSYNFFSRNLAELCARKPPDNSSSNSSARRDRTTYPLDIHDMKIYFVQAGTDAPLGDAPVWKLLPRDNNDDPLRAAATRANPRGRWLWFWDAEAARLPQCAPALQCATLDGPGVDAVERSYALAERKAVEAHTRFYLAHTGEELRSDVDLRASVGEAAFGVVERLRVYCCSAEEMEGVIRRKGLKPPKPGWGLERVFQN